MHQMSSKTAPLVFLYIKDKKEVFKYVVIETVKLCCIQYEVMHNCTSLGLLFVGSSDDFLTVTLKMCAGFLQAIT